MRKDTNPIAVLVCASIAICKQNATKTMPESIAPVDTNGAAVGFIDTNAVSDPPAVFDSSPAPAVDNG